MWRRKGWRLLPVVVGGVMHALGGHVRRELLHGRKSMRAIWTWWHGMRHGRDTRRVLLLPLAIWHWRPMTGRLLTSRYHACGLPGARPSRCNWNVIHTIGITIHIRILGPRALPVKPYAATSAARLVPHRIVSIPPIATRIAGRDLFPQSLADYQFLIACPDLALMADICQAGDLAYVNASM
jgi:hypothetical protein